MSAVRSGGWRGVLGRAAVVAACAVGVLASAGPVAASPGLKSLGDQGIGLPAGSSEVGAVTVRGNEAYAATLVWGNELRVQRFDQRLQAWQPVASRANSVDTVVTQVRLLSMRNGDLYVAWIQGRKQDANHLLADMRDPRLVVERLRSDGRAWEPVMERPADPRGDIELAQVGNAAWVGWDDANRHTALARIEDARAQVLQTQLPLGVRLRGLVGFGTAAYVALSDERSWPARSGPDRWVTQVRVMRLALTADSTAVLARNCGSWDMESPDAQAGRVFLSAGSPDAPARPVLAMDATGAEERVPRIEMLRMRADGEGFDRIPIQPLVARRGIRRLRGLAVTERGIAIAGARGDRDVRVYVIGGNADGPTITDGDRLEKPSRRADEVRIAPVPNADGAMMLGYNRDGGGFLRLGSVMQFTP